MMPELRLGLQGKLQISVVQNGVIVREYPVVKNLILNRGLDDIGSNLICACFRWCAAGTGSTPTELDGGSETVTLVAGTATFSQVGFLNGDASDVGRNIKLISSGNVYLITASISATQCSVSPTDSIGPDNFFIYNTNQTGLTTESTLAGPTTKRTQTYLTGAPNCQSATSGATSVFTRTFDFAAELAPISYNEVGFSTTNAIGSNLFSRVKLPSSVPLTTGQQLRVKYSLSVTISPTTPLTFASSPIIGWSSATGTLQNCSIPLAGVDTNGNTTSITLNSVDGKDYISSDPVTAGFINLTSDSSAHTTYGHRITENSESALQSASLSSYVAGSYTRDKFTTYAVGIANATTWRSFSAITNIGDGGLSRCARYLFNSAQTKLSTFTLTLGFRSTWGRTL